jgi:KipI family sensor histidine kinase inhibitor
VLALGDHAALVEYAPEVGEAMSAQVFGLDAALKTLPGVVETIPAFRSVLAIYDPAKITYRAFAADAANLARTVRPIDVADLAAIEVPVAYGGALGPDLEDVAKACGLAPDDIVRAHSGTVYLAHMIGFAPGFPYLGIVPEMLRLPRRMSPRTRVPAGSVAIADRFTGIYPQETPGGWHLIGRTPVRVFDRGRDPACLIAPGDRVRFVPIDAATMPTAREDEPVTSPVDPVIDVTRPGLMTTIQDLGRLRWRRFGIPPSGAMDVDGCGRVNAVLGNDQAAAVLECAFPAPALRALVPVEIAIDGADFDARVNGAPCSRGIGMRLRAGDTLTFEKPRAGQWAYVGVAGGIDVPLDFGSRATFARGGLGGLLGRPLRAGDVIGRAAHRHEPRTSPSAHVGVRMSSSVGSRIRVVLGPQVDRFALDAVAAFLGCPYEVTMQRDRSGMRLRGQTLTHRAGADILSDGLTTGAVQVPAEGQPIVILADGPTTGGYTKIACVVEPDLARLAQMPPGAKIRFEAVTVDEAHAIRSRN